MEKDVRFTEKKVDQSWKEGIAREKGESRKPETTSSLAAFLSSLGYQALMQLGEVPHPETQEHQVNLDGAKETIDLLILLEAKTRGNLIPEEEKLFKSILPQLQMKFVEKADSLK